MKKEKACQNCGNTGDDVVTALEHVGGQGYVPRTQCADAVACWARWDRQHGFQIKSEYFESLKEHREMSARVLAGASPGDGPAR